MRGDVKNKRGLSPVIASVLMILLVVVLAVMIFLWARGFLSEQIEKRGGPVDKLCHSVEFKAKRDMAQLEVVNTGNVDIHHLDIKLFKGGNSEISSFNVPIDAGKTAKQNINFKMKDGSTPDKIVIYPALIGTVRGKATNKAYTCMDNGVILN